LIDPFRLKGCGTTAFTAGVAFFTGECIRHAVYGLAEEWITTSSPFRNTFFRVDFSGILRKLLQNNERQ
jgi:hypothetical protein